jgi:hypothetical protein
MSQGPIAKQIIVAVRCNWCSRQLSPSDVYAFSSLQAMCKRCWEGHHHALDVLAGNMPRACQECGLTVAELNALSNAPTTRMYVVHKDGIYQVLCLTCTDKYCAKRADLFKGTEFGARLKLG